MRIKKRHALVITGANSLLGREVLRLAVHCDLYDQYFLTARSGLNGPLGIQDEKQIRCASGIDLTKETDLIHLREKITDYTDKGFDVINLTGYFAGQQPLEKCSIEEARKIIDSNYLTVYGVAHSLLPVMRARGGGHFLAFSCNSVNYKYPWMAPFTAAKAAVESLIGSIANEFSEYGIIANVLVLATLRTQREKDLKPYGDHEHWLSVEEVAETALEILRDRKGIVNGNSINLFQHSDTFYNRGYFERIRGLPE